MPACALLSWNHRKSCRTKSSPCQAGRHAWFGTHHQTACRLAVRSSVAHESRANIGLADSSTGCRLYTDCYSPGRNPAASSKRSAALPIVADLASSCLARNSNTAAADLTTPIDSFAAGTAPAAGSHAIGIVIGGTAAVAGRAR